MADKANQVDKTEGTDKVENYEQRYKDSQSHITTIEQENATLRETAVKDKELFDAVSGYIDWDAVNGKTKAASEAVDDDGFVDRKTLNAEIKDLQDLINRNATTQNFRSKYPDMIQYEELVVGFLGRTDPRRPMDERIGKAVENVRKLMESERTKGAENAEKEKKEKKAKEAEVSGLSEAKGPKGEEKEPEGETVQEYVAARKGAVAKLQGLT